MEGVVQPLLERPATERAREHRWNTATREGGRSAVTDRSNSSTWSRWKPSVPMKRVNESARRVARALVVTTQHSSLA